MNPQGLQVRMVWVYAQDEEVHEPEVRIRGHMAVMAVACHQGEKFSQGFDHLVTLTCGRDH